MKLLSLILLPSLALSASVTGTVTLLDGTPLGGAVVKVGADSVVSSANGSFTLGRSTGIASKSGKTIPVTSHLSIVEGRPRLSFGGFDIAGRARPATISANTETPSSQAFGARSVATRDSLKLFWNGKRLFILPVTTDTNVAFKIDTAWKDDAGIPWNPRVSYGSLFDARDGQTYRTVVIGSQMWMAENLNYKVDSSWWFSKPSNGLLYKWHTALGLEDSCLVRSCSSLVNPRRTQGLCPVGWHVPRNYEWNRLEAFVDPTKANSGLRLQSSTGWLYPSNMDWFGFRGLANGFRNPDGTWPLSVAYANGVTTNVGTYGAYTSAIENRWSTSIFNVSSVTLGPYSPLGKDEWSKKEMARALRCIRDVSPLLPRPSTLSVTVTGTITLLDGTPLRGAVIRSGVDSITSETDGKFTLAPAQTPTSPRASGSVDTLQVQWNGKRLIVLGVTTDTSVAFKVDTAWKDDAGFPWPSHVEYGSLFDARDGQTYRTVKIGAQRWMAENLNKQPGGFYQIPLSEYPDSLTRDQTVSLIRLKYGLMYTRDSAMVRCPTGWHLPSLAEWGVLLNSAGDSVAGSRLKSASGWRCKNSKQAPPTNDYGFSVRPGGYTTWFSLGPTEYLDEGCRIDFWTSTDSDYEPSGWSTIFSGLSNGRSSDYTNADFFKYARCLEN